MESEMRIAISVEALLARGYKEFPPGSWACERAFQKAFRDDLGKRFFLNFREWNHPGLKPSWDVYMASEATVNPRQEEPTVHDEAYIWVTLKAASIEGCETLAEAIWEASGGVYYER